jgi:hypothetical protein
MRAFEPQPTGRPYTALAPEQASAALGHSTGLYDSFMGGLKDFSTGVAQSEISTIGNIGTGIEKGLDTVANMIPGVHADTAGKSAVSSDNPALQPQNTMQTVGKVAGDIGQFFIPGGAEKAAVTKGAEYAAKVPELLGMAGKGAKALETGLNLATKGVVTGLSTGAVTAAQTGNVNDAVGAAKWGAGAGVLMGTLEKIAPAISKALNKADFKLTPMQEYKTQKVAEKAADFITKNKITGGTINADETKFKKLEVITQNFENILQASLPKEFAVPKNQIISGINESVESLRTSDPGVYEQARAKANEAIRLLTQQPTADQFTKGGAIGIKDALQGKRSWGQVAFRMKQKGKIDPEVASEGAYAVEQAYQKAIEGTLERTNTAIKIPPAMQKFFDGAKEVTLPQFNAVYSSAIGARNLTGIARYKGDTGLFGRMFGLWVGKTVGHAATGGMGGELVGAAIGESASTRLPGYLRGASETVLAQDPTAVTGGAKIIQGLDNQSQPDQNQ